MQVGAKKLSDKVSAKHSSIAHFTTNTNICTYISSRGEMKMSLRLIIYVPSVFELAPLLVCRSLFFSHTPPNLLMISPHMAFCCVPPTCSSNRSFQLTFSCRSALSNLSSRYVRLANTGAENGFMIFLTAVLMPVN